MVCVLLPQVGYGSKSRKALIEVGEGDRHVRAPEGWTDLQPGVEQRRHLVDPQEREPFEKVTCEVVHRSVVLGVVGRQPVRVAT